MVTGEVPHGQDGKQKRVRRESNESIWRANRRVAELRCTHGARKGKTLEEGISAIVTAQSNPDGSLSVLLKLTDDTIAFRLDRVMLALTLRKVDEEIIRVSLTNPETGSIAYFQSALPAVSLARELGLQLVR